MTNHTFSLFLFLLPAVIFGQVGINSSGNTPHSSAGLDVDFTNRGLLPPRMTTLERDAIGLPLAEGLQIYNTDVKCMQFYNGSSWICGGLCLPGTPSAGTHIPSTDEIEWNWNAVSGAAGYKWGTTSDYGSATDVGASTSYTQIGLTISTSYTLYVWSYNDCGGAQNPVELMSTTDSPPCTVGETGPAGGLVFYCGSAYPGYVGLEVAPSNQSNGVQWGCQGTTVNAGGSQVGTGVQNTADILAGCSTSGIAARLCDELELGGYSDWFLPSYDELLLVYTNLHLQSLGSFTNSWYWSSAEVSSNNAYLLYFPDGSPLNNPKGDPNSTHLRAVRRF